MKKVLKKNTAQKILNENPDTRQDIVIYQDARGKVSLRADIRKETIWATQTQIALLFDVDVRTISEHIKNIYKTGELSLKSTIRNFRVVQTEGKRSVEREINHYDLDVVIATGYRVNSKKATQFRIWATETLRDYIIHGMAVNTERIKKLNDAHLTDLTKKITFIQETIRRRELDQGEVQGLLSVINGYANSWALLQKYDEGGLTVPKGLLKEKKKLEYDFVRDAINDLADTLISKDEASDLFGNELDQTFQGILKGIYQSFGGKEVYQSVEEKAAHLLYFVIKDHPFSDGNKRIGSFLFVLFLELNNVLHRKNGEKKINDNTLVALALLIAESNPTEKDTMVALVTNLLV